MKTETTFALSEMDYAALERAEKSLIDLECKIEKLIAERDEYKEAHNKSLTVALELSIEHENVKNRESSLAIMLGQACDEMEGIFRTTGSLASLEIATEYTVWARYLDVNYGRKEHFAYEVQEWIDKF